WIAAANAKLVHEGEIKGKVTEPRAAASGLTSSSNRARWAHCAEGCRRSQLEMLTRAAALPPALLFSPARTFFSSFQRRNRPELMLNLSQAGIEHRAHHFFRRLVARR